MRTKIFTMLFTILVSIGTMFAWDYERVQIDNLYYNLDATCQTAEVTSQNGSYPYWSTTITTADIPSSVTYNSTTYSVTSIKREAFYGCENLRTVVIGNSVTSIGDGAFSDCSNLSSINIPSSVKSIGNYAFMYCNSLPVIQNIRYADTYLVAVIDKSLSYYTINCVDILKTG